MKLHVKPLVGMVLIHVGVRMDRRTDMTKLVLTINLRTRLKMICGHIKN
jgi:hypothetical protein